MTLRRRDLLAAAGSLGWISVLNACGGANTESGNTPPASNIDLKLLAGSARQSPVSNDGVGSAATFTSLFSCVTNSLGNIYVGDTDALRIVSPTGAVSTVAGLANSSGYADALGSSARFGILGALAIDQSGNILASDQYSFAIRQITPAGQVSTLIGVTGRTVPGAGGANVPVNGTLTNITLPFGSYAGALALDGSGNIYLAFASEILKVSTTGVVTTFAGSATQGTTDGVGSAATFGVITAMTSDGLGNLYVTQNTGAVETAGVASVAATASVRKITPGAVVSTIAGGTSGNANPYGYKNGAAAQAQFTLLEGIALDPAGDFYLADNGNGVVRKLSAGGTVTTVAGTTDPVGTTIVPGPLPAEILPPVGLALAGSKLVILCPNAVLQTTGLP
jgi:hypothetical protein